VERGGAVSSERIDAVCSILLIAPCRNRSNPFIGTPGAAHVSCKQRHAFKTYKTRNPPGVCYRLWDPSDDLDESTAPEIADADLAPLALELAAWGDPAGDSLPWLEAPDPGRMEVARQLLRDLGAVDEKGAVTEGGRRMAALGLHPRFAHLVLRCVGCDRASRYFTARRALGSVAVYAASQQGL
jgi:hypothetical protein